MYILLLILLLLISGAVLARGVRRERSSEMYLGVLGIAATVLFFALLGFLGEMLWFDSVGYSERFWTVVLTKAGLGAAGALFGWAVVLLFTWPISRERRAARFWPETLGAVAGAVWGLASWDVLLKFWHRVPTSERDPILDREISFYLFTLPFYDAIYGLLLGLAVISLAAAAISHASRSSGPVETPSERSAARMTSEIARSRPARLAAGIASLVLAWGMYLNVFHLLYSEYGVVSGPGWSDVNIRLPAYYIVAVLLALGGLALVVSFFLERTSESGERRALVLLPWSPLALAAASWLLGVVLLPGLAQWLYVQPNEISVEKPYISHNIESTRRAFRLHEIEERKFAVSEEFTRETAEENRAVLSQVRLWDPRALTAVYEQFQEIRLYYEFPDVDIDRYTVGGTYQQVMVSPREMEPNNLPRQSQTFVNRRFKYTHGYGLTMAPVSRFTDEGLPDLLIKDLPPKSTVPGLDVHRPAIYYGDLTSDHVIVNTEEKEFDYPSGDSNEYTRYAGTGGVELSNLWRKFIFGWKFDGTRLLVSGYPTPESRLMFHRRIRERVETLAPFLRFDEDPYLVLEDGKLFWIIDGYTTSRHYPYSTPFLSGETIEYVQERRERALRHRAAAYLHGVNYVRNSVKAVVDAYDGSVSFYVFDEEDALIQVWRRIFPELFKPAEEMPGNLRAHVRYPEGFLLAQGLVYARYHMIDPEVFYNQEDVWVRATEKYDGRVSPVEPYYVMWQPPSSEEAEFILMFPFTPKNRQVLIGWMAGMCDGENYGRLLAYRFPKEKRVLGTQQVEAKIDQDPYLSQRLTLWDQRGSRVIRGNVLAIPVSDTLLYVEPIYLQAEAAAYPELRIVALMHNDRLSYASTFDEALAGLYRPGRPEGEPPPAARALPETSLDEQIRRAGDAFDAYLRSLGEKDFEKSARDLEDLSSALERLESLSTGGEGEEESGDDGTDTEATRADA